MTILVAILNAIKDVAKAVLANRAEVAKLNAKLDLVLENQEYGKAVLRNILETADNIWDALNFQEAVRIVMTWTLDGSTTTEGDNVKLTDSQKGTLGPILVLDAKDQPAEIQGVPVWATSDETIATVAASGDGLSAVVTAVRPGACTVTVTGDADLGDDVKPIVGTADITVTAGQAVKFVIPEGTPEEQ